VAEQGPEVPITRSPASPSSLRVHARPVGPYHGSTRSARPVAGLGGARLKLSLIMAAYNEAATIRSAIDEVLAVDYPCDMELIVVDDGSTDATQKLLAAVDDPRVRVLRHPANRGKGAALLTGAAAATGNYFLPFDADLEYVPEDILKLLEPVLRGRCSVVYGVRLFGINTVYRSYVYALGNRMFTRTANILFGSCLSDLHTCLKLMPTDVLRSLRLTETGFGLDTELSASLLRCGVRPFEVPISYYSRSHEEGKKISWRDAFACLRILLRVRVQRRSRIVRASEPATATELLARAGSAAALPEPRQPQTALVNEPAGGCSVGATG
jgi:dolichol-phosphate hexosyltransferase